jgi:hypothetical protein
VIGGASLFGGRGHLHAAHDDVDVSSAEGKTRADEARQPGANVSPKEEEAHVRVEDLHNIRPEDWP